MVSGRKITGAKHYSYTVITLNCWFLPSGNPTVRKVDGPCIFSWENQCVNGYILFPPLPCSTTGEYPQCLLLSVLSRCRWTFARQSSCKTDHYLKKHHCLIPSPRKQCEHVQPGWASEFEKGTWILDEHGIISNIELASHQWGLAHAPAANGGTLPQCHRRWPLTLRSLVSQSQVIPTFQELFV